MKKADLQNKKAIAVYGLTNVVMDNMEENEQKLRNSNGIRK